MWRLRLRRPTFTVHVKWKRRWPGRSIQCWDRVGIEAKAMRIRSDDWDRIGKLVCKWEHLK